MEIEFSLHALEQMQKRKISLDTIQNVLDEPLQVIEQGDKHIFQAVVSFDSKNYLVRVFVNVIKQPNLVITVYLTSKIEKYLL